MSDTPQGPGWWQASDGKYYPPQPNQQAAAPPPGSAPTGGAPQQFEGPPATPFGAAPGGPGQPPGAQPGGFQGPPGGFQPGGSPQGFTPGQPGPGGPQVFAAGAPGFAQEEKGRGNPAGWGVVVGAVLTIIAAFLPWASVFGQTITGVEEGSDGVITIALAVLAGIFGLVRALTGQRWAAIVAILFGLLTTLIAVIDIVDVMEFDITVGIGLWLTLVGGIVMVIAGGVSFRRR